MMLDKKQIQAIFLLEFKMGHKSAEAACNINNTFGPGVANESIAQWWFKKFCKGDKSLEDEECSDRPSEIDNDRLRGSFYNYRRSCQRAQCWSFCGNSILEAN